MHHFVKGLLHQRWQSHRRGQSGHPLNPVQLSLNCFLAALLMKTPGPVYVCGLGRKLFVLGRMLWGWGELSWGLFSNFFCTFGTVTINVPPLYCRFFSLHGRENRDPYTVTIELSKLKVILGFVASLRLAS